MATKAIFILWLLASAMVIAANYYNDGDDPDGGDPSSGEDDGGDDGGDDSDDGYDPYGGYGPYGGYYHYRHPRKCSDIRSQHQCVRTKPCPESHHSSFCYWIPNGYYYGRCACCYPKRCPAPKVFNREKCRCECPEGTEENSRGLCVADCEDIRNSQICPNIYCADNPHFRCKRVGYKCVCPSCDATTRKDVCSRTKCVEQPRKLNCVFDYSTYKCRCPECTDNYDHRSCRQTYCGPNYSLLCGWRYSKCYCPVQNYG